MDFEVLFEAALTLSGPELLRDAPPILVLSGLGTIIAMGVVASGMVMALDWPAPTALVFGELISATDPVASSQCSRITGWRVVFGSSSRMKVCSMTGSRPLFSSRRSHGRKATAADRRASTHVPPLDMGHLASPAACALVGRIAGRLGSRLGAVVAVTLPLRNAIVVVTFGVVAFSIVVQGLTMPFLLRRMRFL
jgi:hypothetical protein